MTVHIVQLDDFAGDWLRESLANGLSLGRRVGELVPTSFMEIEAIATSTDRVRLLEFSRGGLAAADTWTFIAQELHRRFRDCHLFVELPLVQPSDRFLEHRPYSYVQCDNELYAVVSLAAQSSSVETVLRSSDPSMTYNAVVMSGVGVSRCPVEDLDRGDARVEAVVVGAYDGEGALLARIVPTM